jgi:hypothetical protein
MHQFHQNRNFLPEVLTQNQAKCLTRLDKGEFQLLVESWIRWFYVYSFEQLKLSCWSCLIWLVFTHIGWTMWKKLLGNPYKYQTLNFFYLCVFLFLSILNSYLKLKMFVYLRNTVFLLDGETSSHKIIYILMVDKIIKH